MQKAEPAAKTWDRGPLASLVSYMKPHLWVGNFCSLSFQLLLEGCNFVTWTLSTKPAQTDGEL